MATKPVLLDAYGRPIQLNALKQEQGGPSVRGVRQPFGRHQASGLTPAKLGRILRNSIDGDPEAYLELAEDMEERDLHYAGVLSTRKRQVAGLEVTVEAATDAPDDVKAADLVREVVSRDCFQDELVDILDAIGKSFSATEIIWDTSEGQWMPSALKWRDPRWFEFDRDDGETLRLRGEAGVEDLKPFGWIIHRAKVKSGLTIRGGLARAVAWTYLFKSFTTRDWAIFCEAYGQPVRFGKYGPDAKEEDKSVLLNAVTSIGSDFAAIIPDSMTVEFVNGNISGNHELYEKRVDWLDRQVSKVVLGQTSTTDAQKGSYAVGRVHDGVREDIEISDAQQLRATLNRDLVRPLVDLNLGRRKAYPKIRIGRPDAEDIDKLVKNVTTLVPFGLRVGMSTMRDKVGLPEPGKDEEILVAPRQQNMQQVSELPERGAVVTQSTAMPKDAIDKSVEAILDDDGWEPLISPIVAGLEDELAGAATEADAQAIIARRIETMGVPALASMLARASFAARLAGETNEDL
ncbi:DUF935 domain-containing protein